MVAVAVCIAAACGDDTGSDRGAVGDVEVVSPEQPVPGEEFELSIDSADPRSPTWVLSRDGSNLYTLAPTERSAPPHYFPVDGSSLDVSSVALHSPTEILVWPAGLDAGDYELCNADPDDLCVAITIEE